MPLMRRWKRLGFAGQLAVLLSVSLVVIAALVTAIAALVTSSSAGHQAKATANCVNNVLGDRNGPSARDAAAHIAFAQADKRFSDALAAVLLQPRGSQAQRDAYATFIEAAGTKKVADDKYVQILIADQNVRDAKPFGRCP